MKLSELISKRDKNLEIMRPYKEENKVLNNAIAQGESRERKREIERNKKKVVI